jgi:PAS domain S-box-containing protein
MLSSPKTEQSSKVGSTTYLLEHLGVPAWIADARTYSIVFSNPAANRLYGYTAQEFRGLSLMDLVADESDRTVLSPGSDATHQLLVKHRRKNNTFLHAEVFIAPVFYEGKECIQVTAIDRSEKIRMQDEMKEERNRYRAYIYQSSEGIFCQELGQPVSITLSPEEIIERLQVDSFLSECNDAMARMYGFEEASQIIGLRTDQLLDFNDPSNIFYLKKFISEGFRIFEAESKEKDRYGQDCYFLNSAVGIVEDGYLKRIWGNQRDITEKKRIENKISLLASLVEQTADVLTGADLDYRPITWNKAAEKVYGVSAEQALGTELRTVLNFSYQNVTRDELRKIVNLQGEWRGEMYFTRPTDHKEVTLLTTFKLLKDEQGNPLGHVIAGTDITERKEAEARLRESETRFRDVADSAPVMIWISDPENRITYVNQPWVSWTGIDLGKIENAGWVDLLHPDDVEKAKRKFDRHFAARMPVVITYRLKQYNGNYKWVQETGIPRFLEDGSFIGYIGSVVDIHDQKLKEEQLRHQAEILENVSDIIVTTDLAFRVESWNNVAESYYGISAREAIGRTMPELVLFEYQDIDQHSAFRELRDKGIWQGEVSVTNKEGVKHYFLQTVKFVSNADGQKTGIVAVGRDITARKKAEERLAKSELFYRSLIADSLDGMILLDRDATITFASPSVKNVLGYTVEEIKGRSAFDFVHPEDISWALESFTKEVEEQPEIKFIVVRLLKKDGDWLWCMVRGHNLLSNPEVRGIVIYFHDDTLRKKATEALKESEQRFRSLIRDLQIGVLLQQPDGTIVLSNNAMYKMLEVSEQELVGKKIWEVFSEVIHEDGRPFATEERPTYRAMTSRQLVVDVVMGVRHPVSDELIWIIVSVDPVLDADGNIIHLVCSFTNITERKKLEQRLLVGKINHQKQLTQATIDGQEKERTEVGKELHDNIGQQLTTIKLFLDLALRPQENSSGEMLGMALKGVSDVINDVRAMSRALVPSTLKDLGLVDSIHELIGSINRTRSMVVELEDVHFEEDKLAENKKLTLFRIMQEQLNNIVRHAEAKKVAISLITVEGDLILEIRDDGHGFDPAASRKGLGFTNIRNRAELFGGKAEVISAPGKGCLLRVFLPGSYPPELA